MNDDAGLNAKENDEKNANENIGNDENVLKLTQGIDSLLHQPHSLL